MSWLYHKKQKLAEDSLAGATLIAALRLFIKEMGLSKAALPAGFHANSHIDLTTKMPLTSPYCYRVDAH